MRRFSVLAALSILAGSLTGDVIARWTDIDSRPASLSRRIPRAGPDHGTGTFHRAEPLSGLRGAVVSRNSPRVGEELTLELTAHNGHAPGRYRCFIDVKRDGALAPIDGPLTWEDSLESGQTVVHSVRVRVDSAEPIRMTGKIACLESTAGPAAPGQAHLTLYPFEVVNGRTRIQWDPGTLRALSEPALTLVKLADGDIGILQRLARP
ncbi:MAG: hypothetical protein HY815_18320 [Candidatus Riflebacteria bacterium]|nr:hypothetical protein [Candidatus Riflebacteria bacterium]